MQISLSTVKILKTELSELLSAQNWLSFLLKGNFYEFEQLLYEGVLGLYDSMVSCLLIELSKTASFIQIQKAKASEKGLKKLVERPVSMRLRTGSKVQFNGLYAKVAPTSYKGSRHLSLLHWQSGDKASPMYKSLSCLFSVLCPSFDVAKELLKYQGIEANFERTRANSLSLASQAIEQRSTVQLAQGETLAGQRVIIGMDGGRTRTRVYEDGQTGRTAKFKTNWREPKLFVISTIDENGKINKLTKPIYDGCFGDDEVFALLKKYLENLEIDKAQSVQFLADGAPWIWNRVRPMLLDLGVAAEKITETLDYYHAIEHLTDMKVYLDDEHKDCFSQLKDALWRGDLPQMEQLIKQAIKDVDLEEFNPYQYFKKQEKRIDYQTLSDQNSPCGSGIIESGIRRIINLRFKSPSTFWYPDNVEKLFFMRAVALSGRWDIMMNNLFTK